MPASVAGVHVREHRADHLEIADALAELAPLGRRTRVATSRAPWAIPTACAAIPGRLRSNVRIAMPNPSPSSPIRLAAGTRTPSKASSAVGLPRIPILCSIRGTEKPGGRDLDDEAASAGDGGALPDRSPRRP